MPPVDTVAPPRARIAWADAAKGVCILLVVLHHTTTKHYAAIVPDQFLVVGDAWGWLTQTLKPIRMPLFFLLSGFFASSALRRPWALVLRRRVATQYYLYLVWLCLLALVFAVERSLTMNRTQNLTELAQDVFFPSTAVWFLYALAAYFVLAKLLVRIDVRWVVAASAVFAASVSSLPVTEVNRISVLHHFVYFVVGARVPEVVGWMAERRRRLLVPLLLVSYLALDKVLDLLGATDSLSVILLAPVGLTLAVQLVVLASRSARFTRVAGAVGRRTLPIYVMHMPVLAVVHHVPGLGLDLGHPVATATAVTLYPLLVTIGIAATCLGLHSLLLRARLGALFTLPSALQLPMPQLRAVGQPVSPAVTGWVTMR